ncbi:hypothetical protein [Metabacillus fastidiosus]|uniref:hypothetical protein n=1 Tax=Metabacillus fastidiosus TaxID=1458 RepID=UPI003D2D65D4
MKYSDYNETIKEIEIQINQDQRKLFKMIESTDDKGQPVNIVEFETYDDTIAFSVKETLTKEDLRDYVKMFQRMLTQMK